MTTGTTAVRNIQEAIEQVEVMLKKHPGHPRLKYLLIALKDEGTQQLLLKHFLAENEMYMGVETSEITIPETYPVIFQFRYTGATIFMYAPRVIAIVNTIMNKVEKRYEDLGPEGPDHDKFVSDPWVGLAV